MLTTVLLWVQAALKSLLPYFLAALAWLGATSSTSPVPHLNVEWEVWRGLSVADQALMAETDAAYGEYDGEPPVELRVRLFERLSGRLQSRLMLRRIRHRLVDWARRRGDHAAAIRHQQELIDAIPDDPSWREYLNNDLRRLAWYYGDAGDHDAALRTVRRVRRAGKGGLKTLTAISTRLEVAEVYRRAGKPAEGMLSFLTDTPQDDDPALRTAYADAGFSYLLTIEDSPQIARAMAAKFYQKWGSDASSIGLGAMQGLFRGVDDPAPADREVADGLAEMLVRQEPNSYSAAVVQVDMIRDALREGRAVDAQLLMDEVAGNPFIPADVWKTLGREVTPAELVPVPDPIGAPPDVEPAGR